ncbi:hypothetical protein AUEXF2481DRAFT_82275 [Aureobasidium subglaciale EXF-2481]|uniref:Uncharacterized protein n=1 Tax=Aureobasidium subglaciale (strain EXF-2481) TaxID=1043005 RepID=A0A074Y9B6_AURSE|nr:uncharacterized protein AUEXF2481DRAFT_82275 [Aureobasidium subglaciale EXF-2481]KEQ92564.1 hypothetical protein AUEXF2481DRAFT_82275 [Aureobasidium subglaciale EXF-2481]
MYIHSHHPLLSCHAALLSPESMSSWKMVEPCRHYCTRAPEQICSHLRIQNTVARVRKRLNNIEKIRKHKRVVGHPETHSGDRSSTYHMSKDCVKPTIIPPHILWCNFDGEAEQWLRHETVPWWFLGGFINYRGQITKGDLRKRNKKDKSGRTGLLCRRLLACSREYPMKDGKLIEQFEYFYKAWVQKNRIKLGLVNCVELEHDPEPEITITCAAEKLYRMIFNEKEREAHVSTLEVDRAPGVLSTSGSVDPGVCFTSMQQLLIPLDSTPAFTPPTAPVGLGITFQVTQQLVLPFHPGPRSTVSGNSSSSDMALPFNDDVEMKDHSLTPSAPTTLIFALRPSSVKISNPGLRPRAAVRTLESPWSFPLPRRYDSMSASLNEEQASSDMIEE